MRIRHGECLAESPAYVSAHGHGLRAVLAVNLDTSPLGVDKLKFQVRHFGNSLTGG